MRDTHDDDSQEADCSSDFLERPAFASVAADDRELQCGTVLANRFHIRRHLGRGGMGDVYEALDTELGTEVALKTIRPDLADRATAVAALRLEVTRARRVAHPNVARVFDLFTHVGDNDRVTRFLTMQLIDGRSLGARLAASGPLTPEAAWPIARDIAAALDEAHRLGIVHRDLKPGNVMLLEESDGGRAVVTDFGLALDMRDVLATRGRTTTETFGGTPGYVAPEHRSSASSLGPPVDVYAYGVLLHEMLTGVLPGDPGLADLRVLPRRWKRAIIACLSQRPEDRPSRAGLVADSLGPRRRMALPVFSALLVAAVSLAVALLRLPSQDATRLEQPTLVIADLVNVTAEPELDGITEMLRRQVEQSSFVSIQAPAAVRQRLGVAPTVTLSADMAVEAVRRAGNGFVGAGRLRKSGIAYVLTLRLHAVTPDGRGDRSWARSYEASDRADLQGAVQRGAAWMRTTLGEQAERIAENDHAVADVTTESWPALQLYTRAEAMLGESRQEDALAFLEEAVRLDPQFASAWMRMGDILMSRREYEAAYGRWSKALETLSRKDIGTREAYRIRGMFASDTHDYAEAERVYRLYMVRHPDDYMPYFYIARPLLMQGRSADAIDMLERARLRAPESYAIPAQLAMFNLRVRRLEVARDYVGVLREKGHGDWADCIDGQLRFLEGNYVGALDRFTALQQAGDAPLRRRASALRAAVFADLGQYDRAIATLEEAEHQADDREPARRADRLLAIASLQLQARRRVACRDACLLALQADRSPVRVAQAAALLARAGYPAEAEPLATRLSADSPSRRVRADRERIAAEILLARGRVAEAWRRFQAAASLEAPGVYLEYMARGAVAAGERGTGLALYMRMARDPHYFWRYPDEAEPGRWFAAVREATQLAANVPPTTDVTELTAVYNSLVQAVVP